MVITLNHFVIVECFEEGIKDFLGTDYTFFLVQEKYF